MARRRPSAQSAMGYAKRRVNVREPRKRFLIICEGKKTEPNYFGEFRSIFRVPIDIRIEGLGVSPLALVERAKRLRSDNGYDEVWCVFDRDDCPPQDFNRAIQTARDNGIDVAYSNEAFELWYLLHFHFIDTAMSRTQYQAKLDKSLGHPYKKNSTTIFAELLPHQPDAIRNANRLLAQYPSPHPAADNPSTTVHQLVDQLIRASSV